MRNIIETKLCMFFNFLPSKTQGFNNHSYEWRGFWLERCKLFYSKRSMTHVCMAWYDVWIALCMNFLLHFFKKHSNCSPFHCYFLIHGVILLWYFFYFFKSFPWSNQFTNKHFFNHFFETLFEWHAWNCQGLEKVWTRWWRLTS